MPIVLPAHLLLFLTELTSSSSINSESRILHFEFLQNFHIFAAFLHFCESVVVRISQCFVIFIEGGALAAKWNVGKWGVFVLRVVDQLSI